METRANYALIGLFTLAVLTAAFLFVFWFSGKDAGGKTVSYRIIFTGSVSGLSRGASVLYNGLKVGEVVSLSFATNDPNRVVARVDIDATTPMNVDTRARLEYSGLTGVASIQLSGGKPGSPPLEIKDPAKPPIIYADRSDFQDLLETAQRLARKADDVLTRADQLFADNEGSIGKTVKNIEQFTDTLAQNSGGVGNFLSSVGGAADDIKTLSQKLLTLSASAERILNGVNPDEVSGIVHDLKQVTDAVARDRAKITAILGDASELANRLNQSSTKLDSVLTSVDSAVRGVDSVVKNIDGPKLGRTLDSIDKVAQALGSNTADIEATLRNSRELTAKLNHSADQVDDVLKSAQRFLGTGDGQGALNDVADAAKSIRRLADNLDKRTAEITTGINRLTGPGVRDFEAVAAEGKRTLGEINRTLRSFQSNPQQLIFGQKSSIPEYQGRP